MTLLVLALGKLGSSPTHYGSGYIASRDSSCLGLVFSGIFVVALVVITVSWLALVR